MLYEYLGVVAWLFVFPKGEHGGAAGSGGSISVLDVETPESEVASESARSSRKEISGMNGFGDTFGTLLKGMRLLYHPTS